MGGSFATVGKCGTSNFKHILINNAVHDSVGGQPTGAAQVDFPAIALACGYRWAKRASTEPSIGSALRELGERDGPGFLEIGALPGASKDLGRPTTSTHQNKRDFMFTLCTG